MRDQGRGGPRERAEPQAVVEALKEAADMAVRAPRSLSGIRLPGHWWSGAVCRGHPGAISAYSLACVYRRECLVSRVGFPPSLLSAYIPLPAMWGDF